MRRSLRLVSLGTTHSFPTVPKPYSSTAKSISRTRIGSTKQTSDSTGEEPQTTSRTKTAKPWCSMVLTLRILFKVRWQTATS